MKKQKTYSVVEIFKRKNGYDVRLYPCSLEKEEEHSYVAKDMFEVFAIIKDKI